MILGASLLFENGYFDASIANFTHFHPVSHIDILPYSFPRPTFSMDLGIGDGMCHTRSNGVQVLATVVGKQKMGSSTWNTTKVR